jgi:hypothetical protein
MVQYLTHGSAARKGEAERALSCRTPSLPNADSIYRKRNLIERFYAKLKHFRRVNFPQHPQHFFRAALDAAPVLP